MQEMKPEDHRGKGNDKKNHPNKNKKVKQIERDLIKKDETIGKMSEIKEGGMIKQIKLLVNQNDIRFN